uniref:OTU domain-containing protein n=1 Tax=Panagrolaimus sp. PS1159 TaxID=55785 RepID=A0AC35GBA1_9BILA
MTIYNLKFHSYFFPDFNYVHDITFVNYKYVTQLKGDGHCGFRTIAKILTGSESEHRKIRKIIMTEITKNPEMKWYKEAIGKFYCDSTKFTADENMWMWGIDLAAAAHVFGLNIYCKEKEGWQLYNTTAYQMQSLAFAKHIKNIPTILKRNEKNVHYDAVWKMGQPEFQK